MKWISFFLFAIIFMSSCTTQGVEPSRNSKHIIDTTFQQKTIVLQPGMDSLCESVQKTVFKLAVDSITAARQIEMDNLVK